MIWCSLQAVFPCSVLVLVRKQALLVALDGLQVVISCDHLYILSAPNPAQPAKHMAPTSDNFAVRALLKQLRGWASRWVAASLLSPKAPGKMLATYAMPK